MPVSRLHRRRILFLTLVCLSLPIIFLGLRFVGQIWAMQSMSSDRIVIQTPHPVSVASAKDCPIPLPSAARRVEYGLYSEWIAYEAYVRFEAPVADCRLHALRLLTAYNKANPDHPVPTEFTPVTEHPSLFASHELNLAWFDPQQIAHGSEAGAIGSHTPKIWIDESRGIFYYRLTD